MKWDLTNSCILSFNSDYGLLLYRRSQMFQYYCMWRWTFIFLFKIHIWALLYFWRLYCKLTSGFSHVAWYLICKYWWNSSATLSIHITWSSITVTCLTKLNSNIFWKGNYDRLELYDDHDNGELNLKILLEGYYRCISNVNGIELQSDLQVYIRSKLA